MAAHFCIGNPCTICHPIYRTYTTYSVHEDPTCLIVDDLHAPERNEWFESVWQARKMSCKNNHKIIIQSKIHEEDNEHESIGINMGSTNDS